jgi:hypothetical protein
MIKDVKAKAISELINDCSYSPRVVGCELSTDHRYLQSEFGRTAIHFLGCLAENYRNGHYDGRNEYECRCAYVMMTALQDAGLWNEECEGQMRVEILDKLYY